MRKKVNKKLIVALLSFVLLFGGTFGSSLAWLLDTSKDVQNVFTTSDINIELSETTKEFDMVPGHTIDKDPVVTVKAGSEDCWVFIKVEESDNLDDYISYVIEENNWTQLVDENGEKIENVYYTFSHDITEDRPIQVLGGAADKEFEVQVGVDDKGTPIMETYKYSWKPQQVLTKPSVTKQMMANVGVDKPTLSFIAYATQYWKSNNEEFKPYEAWELVKNLPAKTN